MSPLTNHTLFLGYRLEVPQPLVRNILTLIVSVDSVEDPTSTSKRERTPKPVAASTTRREDTAGPPRPSEDTEPEQAEWDISDTSPERKRMATDLVLKLLRRSRPEQLGVSVSSRHPQFDYTWIPSTSSLNFNTEVSESRPSSTRKIPSKVIRQDHHFTFLVDLLFCFCIGLTDSQSYSPIFSFIL